jgi:hypothetical protein
MNSDNKFVTVNKSVTRYVPVSQWMVNCGFKYKMTLAIPHINDKDQFVHQDDDAPQRQKMVYCQRYQEPPDPHDIDN